MRGADLGPSVAQDRPVPGSALLIAPKGTSLNCGLDGRLASCSDADGLWGFPTSRRETWRSWAFGVKSFYGHAHMSTSQHLLPWACSLDPYCKRTWEQKAGACQRLPWPW
jgi:hypothetical protein